jgi:hypothetical protein
MVCGRMSRGVVCAVLILSQLGCQSVYRFRCTSNPSEAGVVIAEEMVGETPCEVEIAKDTAAATARITTVALLNWSMRMRPARRGLACRMRLEP